MYRKLTSYFILGMCVVCIFGMSACKDKSKKNSRSSVSTKVATGSVVNEEPKNVYNNNDSGYSIKSKSIVTNNINVNYPQIFGLANNDIQSKWNNIIKEKVEAGMNNIGSKDKYVLSYKVKTQNENIISILMLGEITTKATENEVYPFMYTYNIDIATGNNIRLKDKTDTEKIAKNLMNGRKYSLKGVEDSVFREYLNLFYKNNKEIFDALNNFDFGENMEYVPGYSYYENGKTYLCMNVNHNLGDYIEILVDN